jgi:citrate synthase
MTENKPREASTAPMGLEGVVAGPSSITFLDGQRGRMVYRGYDAIQLAGHVTYEEVVHLLWEGDLPNRAQLAAFSQQMVENREVPAEVLDHMKRFPSTANPMDVLRSAVSIMGLYDPDSGAYGGDALRRKSVRLTARLATLAAAWDRIRRGQTPLRPDPTLGHSANFLYMVTGQKPDALSVEAMDMYLCLLADHDLNASTFSACVVVSTLSDLYSAVTAALGALKGPLHGGANEKAMEMFLEIKDPARAEAFIEKAIAEKRKIMGFGHRVYKVEDPRSVPLKAMSLKISESKNDRRWYDISQKVAEVVQKQKKIYTNVDFYSASVLYMLGFPTDLFTPVFAVSRVAGWCTHVAEQIAHNRLIRPVTEYVGPTDRVFIPLDKRG